MPKDKKKLVWMIITGAILTTIVLFALVYYIFFYREEGMLPRKDYSLDKRVLFISSYSEDFDTIDLQKAGISRAFEANDIRLDIAYMDMKNYDHPENEELFYQMLRYKLANTRKYDAVLIGDDAALTFAEKHQEELFKGIPMVFFCINDVEHAVRAGENPYITGAVEDFYLQDTIDIAIKFQPEAKTIINIYDGTLTGLGDGKQFYALEDSYPGFEFLGINSSEYTRAEFGKLLDQISEDSILIYMSNFEDAEGNTYTISDSTQFIAAHAKVPIYRSSVGGIGEGVLGGKIVSYEQSGFEAGSMIADVLNGKNIADIPVVTKGESQYTFDYQMLKKYGIKLSLLPTDAVIVNKGLTIFEAYRNILIPVFAFVLLCLIALLAALIDNLRRRRLTRELQSSHDELTETYNKLIMAEEMLKQQYDENRKYTESLEKKEAFIRYQAGHDYLTDLPNRRSAMEELRHRLEDEAACTIIIIDIDDFKGINDSFGHTCGDAVLREVSARLEELVAEGLFFAARFGGDEFLIIVSEKEVKAEDNVIVQLKRVFAKPVEFEEKKHYIKVSMGVAPSADGVKEVGEIVSHADFALHVAKNSREDKCVYYNVGMQDEANQRKEIRSILGDACRNDGFYVVYQPQVDTMTGEIVCYEALVRLKDHTISPGQFIAIAEETDLILMIGRIVTQKVVKQIALWREQGYQLHPVSVNFSSKQILDKGYVAVLKGLLEKYEVSSDLIEIEITENIFINNNEKAMKLFKDFQSIGVGLALDDFGTGYSSISYLTYIPVQKIKLDKSLVDTFLVEGKDAFIDNIIRLAHCLGLKITIEGIEEKHQRDRLKDFACDYIQGYYFSKPLIGEEVVRLPNPIK